MERNTWKNHSFGEEYIEKPLIGEEYMNKPLIGEEYINKLLIGEEYMEKPLMGRNIWRNQSFGILGEDIHCSLRKTT